MYKIKVVVGENDNHAVMEIQDKEGFENNCNNPKFTLMVKEEKYAVIVHNSLVD